MARRLQVAIVGAGIGGLAAAQALRRADCDVLIIEQSSELREVGAGINISPNAVKVLRDFGLEDKIRAYAYEPQAHVLRDWKTGRDLFRVNTRQEYERRFAAPHLSIHRADLHEILQSGLPSSLFTMNARCAAVTQVGDTTVISLEGGKQIEADVVIGADGIKSAVRESLFGQDEPRFTGNIAWRITLAAERLGREKIEPTLTNWLGPGGHVVHYYVSAGRLVNVVAIRETDQWVAESWSLPGDKREVLEAFAGWNERLLAVLEHAETCFKWGIFDRDPLKRWSVGRITLLGDAAHPMLPFLGQGAGMALEDGLLLGILFSEHSLSPAATLRLYEQLRLPRTSRVQLGSRDRAKENHLRSPVDRLIRNAKFKWRQLTDPHALLQRAEWIYGYHPRDSIS